MRQQPEAPSMPQTLVLDRTCGSCTICCHALEVKALAKPAGVPCQHSTGTACGIYRDRPSTCAKWHCLWRKIGALPDALRPDRAGVMLSLETDPAANDPFLRVRIVCRAVHTPDALDRWEAIESVGMFAREGSLPVWTAFGQTASLIYPDAAQADRLRGAIGGREQPPPGAPSGVSEAAVWRRRLGYAPEGAALPQDLGPPDGLECPPGREGAPI